MFLYTARARTKSTKPITFHTYTIQSIPTGIQSFSFLMTDPKVLQAISYRRVGGHTFDFKVTVSGRMTPTSPWITVLESPLTPDPFTSEVDLLIPEAEQRAYTEYLLMTESFATESRIAALTIGFKQLQFLED